MTGNGSSKETVTPGQGGVVTQGFGETKMEVRAETAATATAERERAAIQALFVMAERRPRDWDRVRVALLKDAARFSFADNAIWEIPRGGETVSGPSVRLAEAALRAMGNVYITTQVTYETEVERKVVITVIDVERVIQFSKEIAFSKTVEKKQLPKGFDGEPLAVRTNSYGKKVYILPCTDAELLEKTNREVSKALRTEAFRILPGDILDEVFEACKATVEKGVTADPDAAKKKLVDSFAKLNVMPDDLAKFLGHPISQVSPAELNRLRGVFQAISQGQTTWHQCVSDKDEQEARGAEAPKPSKAPVEANAVPHNAETGEVEMDPIEKEVESIRAALMDAKTRKEAMALAERIQKLPEKDKEALKPLYSKIAKELT